jgi:hypothetical protein
VENSKYKPKSEEYPFKASDAMAISKSDEYPLQPKDNLEMER